MIKLYVNSRYSGKKTLSSSAAYGAGVAGLLLITFLALGGQPNSALLNSILLPLIIVPLGGALGGILFFLLEPLKEKGPALRAICNMFCISAYLTIVSVTFMLGMQSPY